MLIGLIYMICKFYIDYAVFTIRLCRPYKFKSELSKFMRMKSTIPEKQASSPMMPDEFKWRTYFSFNQLQKIYLLHEKITALKNIDVVLVAHDLPFYEFRQIEAILNFLPSVSSFHLSLVEFRWDLYPKFSATEFQLELVQHLYLKNARKADRTGKWPRFTFYINKRESDMQSKVYIRPKDPNAKEKVFVRFEITGDRRWLKNIGIEKPSDFLDLRFSGLTNQILFLDLAENAIRESELNRLTSGLWLRIIKNRLMANGMTSVVIRNRKVKTCPVKCGYRYDEKACPLKRALVQNESAGRLFRVVQKCPKARVIKDFQMQYCKTSKIWPYIMDLMENAYQDWTTKREKDLYEMTGMQLLFPVQPHISPLKIKRSIKKEPADFKLNPIKWKVQDE